MGAQMAKAPRLPELIVPLDYFCKRRCRCLVYRKGGDCDCKLCMVTANLHRFLIDIQRLHSVPGHGCMLGCIGSSSAFVRSLAGSQGASLQAFTGRHLPLLETASLEWTRPWPGGGQQIQEQKNKPWVLKATDRALTEAAQ